MENTGFDIVILILRIAFIFVLYFFIFLVVRVITREFNNPSQVRRSSYANDSGYVATPEPVAPPLNPSTGVPGRLVVTQTGNASTVRAGMVFNLQPVTPLGRRPDNVIILDDNYVSSQHSLIALRDGAWWLSDVASTNGTFLNEQPLTQPSQLNYGDVVGIGRVRLRLEP
jgi:hypothetical protein